MTSIGIVGCGFIGAIHATALRLLMDAGAVDAGVVAVHDLDHERAADVAELFDGARVAATVEEVVGAADAVWVCTWTSEHLPAVRAAAGAGRAVFCEKPLAPTLAGCGEVAALLRAVDHQVDLPLRSAPVFRLLADRLAAGDFGRPLAVLLRSDQFWPVSGHYASDWRADPARTGGGALVEHSIHDLDLLAHLLGEVRRVTCRTRSFRDGTDLDDVASVLVEFDTPPTGQLTSVWHEVTSRGSTRRLEVLCEDAVVWTDDDFAGPLWVHSSDGLEEVDPPVPAWLDGIPGGRGVLGLYGIPNREFLDFLATGDAPAYRPTAGDALAAHVMVEACYRSAREGSRPVAVAEVGLAAGEPPPAPS